MGDFGATQILNDTAAALRNKATALRILKQKFFTFLKSKKGKKQTFVVGRGF